MKQTNARLITRILFPLALFLQVAVFAQLTSAQTTEKIPRPEYYGVYYVQRGNLYGLGEIRGKNVPKTAAHLPEAAVARICESSLFERLGTVDEKNPCKALEAELEVLLRDAEFLVFSQDALTTAKNLTLGQFSYVRNLTVNGPHPPSHQFQENSWDMGILEGAKDFKHQVITLLHPITLVFKPVEGHPDMVLVVPSTPLKPGPYLLFGDTPQSLFVINPVREGESEACVDAVYSNITPSIRSSSDVKSVPCNKSGGPSTSTPAALNGSKNQSLQPPTSR